MEYGVLGQLSASAEGARVKLGGKRQRLVLAVLLANANRVVSQDALLDAVWEGELPEGGPRTLHTYISILRKTLGGALGRDGGGYVLEVASDQLDSQLFESLVVEARTAAESDPSRANELLRRGLGLWRGPAYGDLGHHLALMPEVTRLTDERAAALETRFELDLLLGRHEEIVPEVDAVLHEHPYRENVAAILMLALYRSGRQAEALRKYQRVREKLIEDLGIEPGRRLQDLELAILAADPRLTAPVTDVSRSPSHRGARGYELHEEIGSSQVGKRFRGFQSTLGREVSVLVVDGEIADSPRFIQRFEKEMQAMAQLDHPHLAPVFDYWREPHEACVISPFYRGGNVDAALHRGELSVASVVRLCDQVAGAVGFLHRHGYSHGGIDTGSVFFDEDMNAFLGDVGMAAILTPELGDRAEDVRQLGELTFRALTLHPPGDDQRMSRWRPDLPGDLDHAVARALHPDPELRFERVEDFARAVRQSVGLDVMAMPGGVPPEVSSDRDRRNPYKGLRAFHEADAADFHGRDLLIDEMADALAKTRLLAVVGPSGSGKSSAVRAGLFPKLRRGEVSGGNQWLITDMFPGTHPFEALEAALLRVATTRPPDLHERLTRDEMGLAKVVEKLLPDEVALVLLVDQFEELFSLTESRSESNRFLDALTSALQIPDSRLHIILTLRADFFDQPLQHPEFAAELRSSVVTVSPPTRNGLARAIFQPAEGVGVSLEPGLGTRIVDDVWKQPGGLPLLQFALTELFAHREGDVLTQAAYEALGGVNGGLARRAEETYSSLPPDAREATRQMFLRLVAVDELADDTRRRVRQGELLELELDPGLMDTVIQRFGAMRFLTFDRDGTSRAPTVELAHEAILREWHRLRTWIDERREDLLIHRRVQIAVQDWRDADHDPGYLLRGVPLQQAATWLARTDMAVSEEERELIEESIDLDEREQTERERLELQSARRRQVAIWVLAGAVAITSVLGIYAIAQRGDALLNASEATARELSQAAAAITEDDPELGILLAAEAIAVARQADLEPLPESLGALWSAYIANRVELTIPAGLQAIAYSPSGAELAVDSRFNGGWGVTIHDATTGEELARLQSPESDPDSQIFDIEYSSDGNWIVVGRGIYEERGAVEIFDAETGELEHRTEVSGYLGLSVSGTGLVATADLIDQDEGTIELTARDLETFEVVGRLDDVASLGGTVVGFPTQFVRGSTQVAVGLLGAEKGRIVGFDVVEPQVAWDLPVDITPYIVSASPSGDVVALSNGDVMTAHDIAGGQPLFDPINHQDPQTLTWSPDSRQLAISGNESDVTIIDAMSGSTQLVLSGHGASVFSVSFDPNGDRLASVSFDGSAKVWDISPHGAAGSPVGSPATRLLDVTVTADRVVLNGSGDGARVFDRSSGAELRHHIFEVYVPVRPMVADQADLIAGIGADGTATVADLDSATVVETLPRCSSTSAISPDGTYLILDSDQLHLPAACEGATTGVSGIYDSANDQVLVDYGDLHIRYGAISGAATFDGARYAAATIHEDGRSRVEIWRLDPLVLLGTIPDTVAGNLPILLLTFSSDARFLAIGTNGPRALAVDVSALASGAAVPDAIVFNREIHTGNVPLARVTDDQVLVTSSFDGFYRFWDLSTGELTFEMAVDDLGSYGVHDLSLDGEFLYYEDGNSVVRRMPIDLEEIVGLATASATRALTDGECRRYLHIDGCE